MWQASMGGEIKDYSVQIKIRNNRMLEQMRSMGFGTAVALAKAAGVNYQAVVDYLGLKRAPLIKSEWSPAILRIAETLRCLPEDLFPVRHLTAALKKNTAEVKASAADVDGIISSLKDTALPCDIAFAKSTVPERVTLMLAELTPKQERILRLRFGLDGGDGKTLEEIGQAFGVTRDRIRQIEAKALAKLRHPSRQKRLHEILEDLTA